MATKEQTPMMVQYHQIKDQYPDAFVFYRMGIFTSSLKMMRLRVLKFWN